MPDEQMTLAELLRELAGEPSSYRVEIAVIQPDGSVALVVPVASGDVWWMRQAHAFRLAARIPAPPAVASETDGEAEG